MTILYITRVVNQMMTVVRGGQERWLDDLVLLVDGERGVADPPPVDGHGDEDAEAGDGDAGGDPEDHHGHLRLGEEVLQAELDVEDELGEGDAEEHPRLAPQPLALLVRDVRVILPENRRAHLADFSRILGLSYNSRYELCILISVS